MPNGIREIDEQRWSNIEQAFYDKDNEVLIKYLLNLDLFPIKDSYAAPLPVRFEVYVRRILTSNTSILNM